LKEDITRIMAEKLKTVRLTVNSQNVNLDEIVALSGNAKKVFIREDRAFIAQMEQSRKMIADAVEKSILVYGVTTG